LTSLDLAAGVEQPLDCLIVQNRQAVLSMRGSMNWTLEDNIVDGLFFCATLTGRRVCYNLFVEAGGEASKGVRKGGVCFLELDISQQNYYLRKRD